MSKNAETTRHDASTPAKTDRAELRGLAVKSSVKAGPNRRAFDHIGNYNVKV